MRVRLGGASEEPGSAPSSGSPVDSALEDGSAGQMEPDRMGSVLNPSPAPEGTAPAGLACAVNLAERFGGFSLKGGTQASVSSTFDSYPGKVAEFSFPVNSKLSYSNGRLTAAAGVSSVTDVNFEVKIPGVSACMASLKARLLPDDSFVTAGAQERGLKGKLYALTPGQSKLPDFSTMMSEGDVYISSVDVPKRSFLQGFPGVAANLTEWFAIDFSGLFLAEVAGDYQFKVSSDDGSRVYLNGQEIINNDGQHSVKEVESSTQRLERGAIPLRLSYFQGPKEHIALQLFYKGPGVTEWTIVPQSMLRVAQPQP